MVPSVMAAFPPSATKAFLIKVTYDTTAYAIEIESSSLDEFNKKLIHEYESTVITSHAYFERALQSCRALNMDAKFIIRPKVLPARPSALSPESVIAPVTAVRGSNEKDVFHVMLSYEWTSGKQIVKRIKEALEARGLRVWFDEEEMRGNMFERMAEGVSNSLVIIPVLTVAYSKSANCKRELSYAGVLKKHIEPTCALKPDEKLDPWVELLTAGIIYYDFNNALEDPVEFNNIIESLSRGIRQGIDANKPISAHFGNDGKAARETEMEMVDPLRKWLQPVDFGSEIEKFKNDYVPGTRMWALKQVHEWLIEGEKSLLWLNGGAGLGKSIIAYLVSENLPSDFILGCGFFCKHDDDNKNNAKGIVATLAFQLASKLPEYRVFLIKEIENDNANVKNGETSVLEIPLTAFKELIVNGLSSIKQPSTNVLIIIDALDEIGRQGDSTRDEFLNIVRYEVEKLPKWVRVFTTSRPELDIYEVLNGVNSSTLLPQDSNNLEDIQAFVKHHLSLHLSVNEKPSENQLTQLVAHITQKTGGVFHYARLACSSLTEGTYTLWSSVVEAANRFDGGLDQIYLQVLENAFAGVDGLILERFRKVMGVVITAREPLHQDLVARLLGMTVAEVGGIILRIQSILNVSGGVITILHKSLKDFLSSPERCVNPLFYIDINTFETMMAISCLNVMIADLSQDMANIKDETQPTPANSAKCINQTLAYACKFWITHILASRDSMSIVLPPLFLFCSNSLLYWVESMILLQTFNKELGTKTRHVAKWVNASNINGGNVKTKSQYDATPKLLEDIARFIGRFETTISHYPLQIYSVGVPFTPQETELYQTYHSQFNAESAKVVPPDLDWGSHLQYFLGHAAEFNFVSFSPNGAKLMSTSCDKTIRLWDVATGKELYTLEGHDKDIHSACMSKDGKLVASGSDDGSIIFWDANTGKMLYWLERESRAIAFSPDSSRLAVACFDRIVRIFDVKSRQEVKCMDYHSDSVLSLHFGKDGLFILSGSWDGCITIWDLQNVQNTRTLVGHTSDVLVACYSNNGSLIASTAWDYTVRVWDEKTGAQIVKLEGHSGAVKAISFSNDDTKPRVLSASLDKSLILWDVETGQQLWRTLGNSGILCCALSPDGKTAVSGSQTIGALSAWDLSNVNASSNLKAINGHVEPISCIALSRDGRRAASTSLDGRILLWSTEHAQSLQVLTAHSGKVLALAWSFDDSKIIVGGSDGLVMIYNVLADTLSDLTNLEGHERDVMSVCLSSDGVVAAAGSKDGSIIVWDVETSKLLTRVSNHKDAVRSVSFGMNSRFLISGSYDKKVILWDLESNTGAKKLEGHQSSVWSAHMSMNGKLVVSSGEEKFIRMWDAETGMALKPLEGLKSGAFSVCFSADGQKLLSASWDNKVLEWDLSTGEIVRSMNGSRFAYLSTIGKLKGVFYMAGSDEMFATFVINNKFAVCYE
ncbi:hypothetical protein HDU76_003835 [Blyttiomyces sp. JEL0837]|nr:hypothetical protein HDU76_003835 [Blyttiomyces sp. JEL0837]